MIYAVLIYLLIGVGLIVRDIAKSEEEISRRDVVSVGSVVLLLWPLVLAIGICESYQESNLKKRIQAHRDRRKAWWDAPIVKKRTAPSEEATP